MLSGANMADVKQPQYGTKYRIINGKYHGRLCVIAQKTEATYVTVTLLDSWGMKTKEVDVVPINFLDMGGKS